MTWILHKYQTVSKSELKSIEGQVEFYADHNLDYSIVEALRIKKFNIETAKDIKAESQSDEFHYKYTFNSKKVLLTLDDDFLNNDQFPLNQTNGVIILNVNTSSIPQIASALEIVYVILGKLSGFLKEKKVIVNSDRTMKVIERKANEDGFYICQTRYRFDDNGLDIWEWQE